MVNMGNKMKTLRVERNFTQKQVADRVGVAVSAISSYESGMRYPSYEVLIRYARMFHVSSDYLLGISSKRTLDVSALDNHEIEVISQLIEIIK